MTDSELIEKLLTSENYIYIFPKLDSWKDEYNNYAHLIHPDKCKHPKASEAMIKLNKFKDELELGKKHKDDAGIISYTHLGFEIIGNKDLLRKSFQNYSLLLLLKDKASENFKRYIPVSGDIISENEYKYDFSRRAVPISSLENLKQEHVNWILSRLLEFSAWINQIGYCHAGLNPDSVYIVPENHGIIVTSFYHFTKLDKKLTTVSGKYSHFYPSNVFENKIATSNIDIELSKKIAIYLLGDKSGTGNKLRKTHNTEILDFIKKQHHDTHECYRQYRELLKKHFKSQFIELNI